MTQSVVNDSKARILNAFQKILAERQTLQTSQYLEPATQNTESVRNGLANLQLEFKSVIEALSLKLITENQRLIELRQITQQISVKSHSPQHDRIIADTLKQGYERQIQSLEAKILKQTEQIAEVSTQLQSAMQQAQDLVTKALELSSR